MYILAITIKKFAIPGHDFNLMLNRICKGNKPLLTVRSRDSFAHPALMMTATTMMEYGGPGHRDLYSSRPSRPLIDLVGSCIRFVRSGAGEEKYQTQDDVSRIKRKEGFGGGG